MSLDAHEGEALQQWAPGANQETMGIERFQYPPSREPRLAVSWEAFGKADAPLVSDDAIPVAGDEKNAGGNLHAACAARLADEVRRSFEAGRERGLLEGRMAEREVMAASSKAGESGRMEQAARMMGSFDEQRNRYFEDVEQEVVKLALAVAARILRREAQMDPLLLTGAVRVALGQLSASTKVRLLVPPAELELWTDTMTHLPNVHLKPLVAAGDGMRLGDCVMETEMGYVDLGLRAQLVEIERCFFDRTAGSAGAQRTAVSAAEAAQ